MTMLRFSAWRQRVAGRARSWQWILVAGAALALAGWSELGAQDPPEKKPPAAPERDGDGEKKDQKSPEERAKDFRERISKYFKETMLKDDKNGDGKLGKDEMGDKWERLARFDKNGDGSIEQEEYVTERTAPRQREAPGESAPRERRQPKTPAEQAQDQFARYDKDKDGKVTKEEAPNLFADGRSGSADGNGDGSVTLEELAKWNQSRQPGGQQFAGLDKNGDGKISKEEAPNIDAEYPGADADKDGAVSRDEFGKAFRDKMRKDREGGGMAGNFEIQFKQMDRNADGKVTKEEAPTAFERIPGLDADGDGAFTLEEFTKAQKRAGEGRERPRGEGMGRAGAMPFAKLDKDGDGKLSKEEAGALMTIPGIDSDGNGSISPEEYEAKVGAPRAPDKKGESMGAGEGKKDK
ncbi:MAG: hypothetical protein L0Z55_05595 [Planctomycetes bacterium]|nr:hypothetical protein [Planctomycetota bacterium]